MKAALVVLAVPAAHTLAVGANGRLGMTSPVRASISLHHIQGEIHGEPIAKGLRAVDELPTMYRARWAGDHDGGAAEDPYGSSQTACIVDTSAEHVCGELSFDSVDGGYACVEVSGKWVCA